MGPADDLLWQAAEEQGMVPHAGFGTVPTHVQKWIVAWLLRQAAPCAHLDPLSPFVPLVVRVAGDPIAYCPACAKAVFDALNRCARCGTALLESQDPVALSMGHTLIVGCWCPICWNGEHE